MKRIFYYSGYRLTVIHWHKSCCVASYVFDPGQAGLEKFKTYLEMTHNTPARVLVDLIEEDFKKEPIPHVSHADRKSIVSRLVDRQYRKSKDYVHYRVIDRQTSGRRDDIIMYSVLSNPQLLTPWLNILSETKTIVSGIWSLPLLTEQLFKKLNLFHSNILLISQQMPSNLRQTFIKNGKFENSRSAAVNLDDTSIGNYIKNEVEQTVRFLSNQRHIGFDETIEIHVICRQRDIAEIQSHCVESALRSYHYHSIGHITELLGCQFQSSQDSKNQINEYSNGMFSYICADQFKPLGHYGNASLFSYYYQKMFSQLIYASSALLLLLSGIFSLSYIADSTSLDSQTHTLLAQTRSVNKTYEKTLANLAPQLAQSQLMQSSVLLSDKIKQTQQISPQNFMVTISRILSLTGMHDTQITKINWQLQQNSSQPKHHATQQTLEIDYASSQQIKQLATISGFIRVSKSSLKESVDKVNALASALKNNRLIQQVNINHMPVDIRSSSSIENESGVEIHKNLNSDKHKGQFEIELLMLEEKL